MLESVKMAPVKALMQYKGIGSLCDERQRLWRQVGTTQHLCKTQTDAPGFHGCLCDGNSQAIPELGASGHMLLVNERVCLVYGLGWGQLAVGVGGGRVPP